jgi:hypothetical protein
VRQVRVFWIRERSENFLTLPVSVQFFVYPKFEGVQYIDVLVPPAKRRAIESASSFENAPGRLRFGPPVLDKSPVQGTSSAPAGSFSMLHRVPAMSAKPRPVVDDKEMRRKAKMREFEEDFDDRDDEELLEELSAKMKRKRIELLVLQSEIDTLQGQFDGLFEKVHGPF